MNPGPDESPHGSEHPPLEASAPPADPYAPVDYPDAAPPSHPAPSGYPPPGYQQPGYPQTGYPPPPASYPPQYQGGYSYGYDPYATARPAGTNGKAIAALITSLAGLVFCGAPSIVGVILGVIAMRETKRTGQEGHAMALAGVIVGALVVLGWVLYFGIIVAIIAVDGTSSSYSA